MVEGPIFWSGVTVQLSAKTEAFRGSQGWQRWIPSGFRGRLTTNVVKLGGGTAIGQALVALVSPIITRLYSPGDLALIGLLVSFVTFASVGVTLRYDVAIVTALDDVEADNLLSASMLATVLCSAGAAGILAVFVRINFLSYGILPFWSVGFGFLMLVLMGASSTLRYWYVRRDGFGLISRALMLQGVGRASVSVGVGAVHHGWLGLLAGEVAGRSLGVARMFRGAWPAMREAYHRQFERMREALVRNGKYPLIVLPSALINSASAVVATPIIIDVFGRSNGGQFFLVQNLLGLPSVLVANSVADVLHAKFAEAYLADSGGLPRLMYRALTRLALVSMAIYIPIALIAPFGVRFILGPQWTQAGLIAMILAPMMITALIVSPASRILVVVDRPEWKLIVDVVRIVLPPGCLYVAHTLGWTFISSLIGFSLVAAAANLMYLFIVWRASFVRAAVYPNGAAQ